jgi:hypothetical protein
MSSPAHRCGISSCVCDKYRKVEFAWSLSFGSTETCEYGDTALTDGDQDKQDVPASGQIEKPRRWETNSKHLDLDLKSDIEQDISKGQGIRYTTDASATTMLETYKKSRCNKVTGTDFTVFKIRLPHSALLTVFSWVPGSWTYGDDFMLKTSIEIAATETMHFVGNHGVFSKTLAISKTFPSVPEAPIIDTPNGNGFPGTSS